jgi:hypothetical protein
MLVGSRKIISESYYDNVERRDLGQGLNEAFATYEFSRILSKIGIITSSSLRKVRHDVASELKQEMEVSVRSVRT